MKIYTKTGDKGETALWGGRRVSKNNLRLNAYGTVDELSSLMGVAESFIENEEISSIIKILQNDLFNLGADLATPMDYDKPNLKVIRISEENITQLEKIIDDIDTKIPALKEFILPGGSKGASFLHLARTVCRRAERQVVELSEKEMTGNFVIIYLNRLSDLLFVLARYENIVSNTPEPAWKQ